MPLYKMELYKVFHNKMFLGAWLIAVGIVLLFFWYEEIGTQHSAMNGHRQVGYQAIHQDRKIVEEFEGALTDEKVEEIVEKYGFPNVVKEGYPGFYDENFLTAFVTRYASDGYIYDWDNYKIPTRIVPLAQSELIKDRKEVMLYYTRGWEVLLEMMQLGMILGNIVIIIGASRILAEESQLRMIPLLFTTEKGKKEDIIAKVLAILTMTIAVYIMTCVLSIVLTNMVFGLDGADCLYWSVMGTHSWITITVKEAVVMLLGMNFLGALFICSISFCVSAYFQSAFYAVTVTAIIWGLPVLVRILFGNLCYLFICSSPIFLSMYECVMDVWNVRIVPISIAVIGLFFCMIQGCLVYSKKRM